MREKKEKRPGDGAYHYYARGETAGSVRPLPKESG